MSATRNHDPDPCPHARTTVHATMGTDVESCLDCGAWNVGSRKNGWHAPSLPPPSSTRETTPDVRTMLSAARGELESYVYDCETIAGDAASLRVKGALRAVSAALDALASPRENSATPREEIERAVEELEGATYAQGFEDGRHDRNASDADPNAKRADAARSALLSLIFPGTKP